MARAELLLRNRSALCRRPWIWCAVAVAAVFVAGCGDGATTSPTPNRALEPTGAIADLAVHVGESAAIDLSPYFADPDGDALSYGASSSNPAVAVVSVSVSTVTITALATGSVRSR